jgi:peptidoglycan/LPS O-acetylase OafA/YrhL
VVLAGFLISVAFSAAMYFLIEKRMARLRRRLHAESGHHARGHAQA